MKTENQAVLAAKSRARSLEKFLKKQGVTLPYAKHLEAVANMDGYKSWEALEGSLSLVVTEIAVPAAPAAELLTPSVRAKTFSDDYRFEVSFDAAAWFAQASDDEITGLKSIGWAGDEASDAVALHFESSNSDIADMLDYCRASQTGRMRDGVGFECKVDGDEALDWLKWHRPELHAIMLCRENGVSLVQAEEPEIKGMWDWLSEDGDVCAQSFATEGLAALDAVNTLSLTF